MPGKVVISMCQCSMTLPNRQAHGTSWKNTPSLAHHTQADVLSVFLFMYPGDK
jgi:hypothetical protein